MEKELMPCPFCGGHVQPTWLDPADGVSGIYCHGCRAMVKWNITMEPKEKYGENMRKWAEKWNRRDGGQNSADN